MKHSLALLLCSWLVPTLMLGSCGSARSVELVGGELAEVTSSFLASLDAGQQKAAQRAIDHEEVMKWHFVPGRYAGVEMGALDPGQRRGADEVLRTMLSATGFAKAMAIVDLENVLHELESKPDKPAVHRDPNRYALLVCGTPEPGGTFVVRYQGHHLSLRMAVVDGMLVSHSPHFLGTNPHVLPEKFARQPVLGTEEQLGRELLTMFDGDDRARVVIAAKAPADVILGPGKEPALLSERRGMPWSAMNEAQRAKLWSLLETYAHVLRPAVAKDELQRIQDDGLDEVCFAWAGSDERGEGHYYRIHGNHFAIEYDCTQNGANHVHVVWRDFERDFGIDMLREHLRSQH
jgi:hypothetical protein